MVNKEVKYGKYNCGTEGNPDIRDGKISFEGKHYFVVAHQEPDLKGDDPIEYNWTDAGTFTMFLIVNKKTLETTMSENYEHILPTINKMKRLDRLAEDVR